MNTENSANINSILTIPKNSPFVISAIDLEDNITERLFAMCVRIDCIVRVITRYRRKILVQISEKIKIVLDEKIASKIFIDNI